MADLSYREIGALVFEAIKARRVSKDLGREGLPLRWAMWVGGIGGIVMCVIAAVGQCYALGVLNAGALYWRWWVCSPLIGAVALLGFLVVFCVVALMVYLGDRAIVRVFGSRGEGKFEAGVAVAFIGILVVVVVGIAGMQARDAHPLVSDATTLRADTIREEMAKQKEALVALGSNGRELFDNLEALSGKLSEAKDELRSVLEKSSNQVAAVAGAERVVASLENRQRDTELRLAEMGRLLEGQVPITKSDLAKAGWSGLFYGGIIGFFGSLGASAVFSYIRRKKE